MEALETLDGSDLNIDPAQNEFDYDTQLVAEELNVLPLDHSILTTKQEPFNFETHGKYAEKLADVMLDRLVAFEGAGLSANQLGIPTRVFAMGNQQSNIVMFNPEILQVSDKQIEMAEGCLSFPGLVLKITRPKMVAVRWQDAKGETHEGTFEGIAARIILHEYDHLNGVTFMMRTTPYRVENALNRLRGKVEKIRKRNEAYERLYKAYLETQIKQAELKEQPAT